MRVAPATTDCFNLRVAAPVIDDALPCSDGSAEAERQLCAFSQLALGLGNGGRVCASHLRGDPAIGMQLLVAAAVVLAERVEFPLFAGEPGEYARLDGSKVDTDQLVSGGSAEHSAPQIDDDLERISLSSA